MKNESYMNYKRFKTDYDITVGRYECSLKFKYDTKFIEKSRHIKFKFDITKDEADNFLTRCQPTRVNQSRPTMKYIVTRATHRYF